MVAFFIVHSWAIETIGRKLTLQEIQSATPKKFEFIPFQKSEFRKPEAFELKAILDKKNHSGILASLLGLIQREIETGYSGVKYKEATGRDIKDPQSVLFSSNIDWHSSVHAHWASFRIARYLDFLVRDQNRTELVELRDYSHRYALELRRRLIEGLSAEENYILRIRGFSHENPYGKTWFLRLAMEFERFSLENELDQSNGLNSLADQLADQVLEQMRRGNSNGIQTEEYQNQSFAFTYLHEYNRLNSREAFAETQTLMESRLVGVANNVTFGSDIRERRFFSTWGNWAYAMGKTQRVEDLNHTLRSPTLRVEHLGIPNSTDERFVGLALNRYWVMNEITRRATDLPVSVLALFESKAKHYNRAFEILIANQDDYQYAHWLPQLAVHALTDSFDDEVYRGN